MSAVLYDDLVMEHIKNARNYRVIADADRSAGGSNPLCGDEMSVYLKIAGQRIGEIGFQCTCCGIAMASASMMTEMVKGRRVKQATALLRYMLYMLETRGEDAADEGSAERLAMMETVQKFPARVSCAALPWVVLQRALAHGARIE